MYSYSYHLETGSSANFALRCITGPHIWGEYGPMSLNSLPNGMRNPLDGFVAFYSTL